MANIDWNAAEIEYVTSQGSTYGSIASAYGVSKGTIGHYAKTHEWPKKKEEYQKSLIKDMIEKKKKDDVDRLEHIFDVADDVLTYVEQAMKDLDKVPIKRKYSKRDKRYEEGHEITEVTETETYEIVQGVVDPFKVSQITIALRNIKEIQMLRSAMDKEEQQARIDRLRADADRHTEAEGTECGIVFMPEVLKDE